MTYQGDPNRPRRYSLREDGGSIAAPVLVAAALIIFMGYLLLGPTTEQQPSTTTPKTELPNTNPSAPPVPTPAPKNPQ